uniref:Uncharacterized protein n=1 Tax=Stomoxys calcitrans TaxID=35570 RepID=A0A1I8QB32_STOCA
MQQLKAQKALTSTPVRTMAMTPTIDDGFKVPTITCDNVSPHTPYLGNAQRKGRSQFDCRSKLINNFDRSPICNDNKLQPKGTVENDDDSKTPSPHTPRGYVYIYEPMPSYRLKRLRHHLHAHKPPQYGD